MLFAYLILTLTAACDDDYLRWEHPGDPAIVGFVLRAEWIGSNEAEWQLVLPPQQTSFDFGCSIEPAIVCLSSINAEGQESTPTCMPWEVNPGRRFEWNEMPCYIGPDHTRDDSCTTIPALVEAMNGELPAVVSGGGVPIGSHPAESPAGGAAPAQTLAAGASHLP